MNSSLLPKIRILTETSVHEQCEQYAHFPSDDDWQKSF